MIKKRMKILQVINSLSIGGAETLVVDLAIKMSENNNVTIFVLGGENSFLTTKLQNANINVVKITTNIRSIKNLFWLQKNMNSYDVVHSHLSWAQYFVSMAAITNKKCKTLTTEHNTTNRRQQSGIFKLIEKSLYSQFDNIICINDAVLNSMEKWQPTLKEKFTIIQNGIDISKFTCAEPIEKTKKIRIVMTAAFREQKDQDTLIKAMAILPDEYELLLVGDGERRSILEHLVQRNNLQNKVNFLGVRSDIPSIIKSADVFVLSSHWEGLPLSIIEAMAAGIPIIGSRVSGLTETIGEAGLLFEHRNHEQLSQKIELLCTDRKIYTEYVKKGLCESEKYDLKQKCVEHIELYNR